MFTQKRSWIIVTTEAWVENSIFLWKLVKQINLSNLETLCILFCFHEIKVWSDSDLLIIKCNYTVVFLNKCTIYLDSISDSKYCFSQTIIRSSESCQTCLKQVLNYWASFRLNIILKTYYNTKQIFTFLLVWFFHISDFSCMNPFPESREHCSGEDSCSWLTKIVSSSRPMDVTNL